jgi:hypothetical protein
MIQTVNVHDFRQAFIDHDRGEQFSYEALGLIFDYFEELENDTGEQVELDVIATCCEVSEMTDQDVRNAYNLESSTDALEYLTHHTIVIGHTNKTIIYIQF